MSIRTKIWNTKLVDEAIKAIEEGRATDTSCFWAGDFQYRAANINFELTDEELKEFVKCSRDVVYFADKYAYAMTDDGIANITLRPYQEKMLTTFQNKRFVAMLASRQIGKCHFFNTKLYIRETDTGKKYLIPVYEFRHKLMKPILNKLSLKNRIIYKTKYLLYKIYDKLDS